MGTIIDNQLTYRDNVVHIFTGILFNVFMAVAYCNNISSNLWEIELKNEIILSFLAIPVFFLEGHLLLAIDRIFFIDIPRTYFLLKSRKMDTNTDTEEIYLTARRNFYNKHSFLFKLLCGKRIIGQKVIQEKENNLDLKTKREDNAELCSRYYILSDFFKGCGISAWIALIVACVKHNWWAVIIFSVLLFLLRQRCSFYSSSYVKNKYAKK